MKDDLQIPAGLADALLERPDACLAFAIASPAEQSEWCRRAAGQPPEKVGQLVGEMLAQTPELR